MGKSDDGPRGGMGASRSAAEVMGAGLQFAGAILIFLFLGRWLDERFRTEPWLLLGGVLVGSVGGFISLYRQLVTGPRESERKRREGASR